MNTKCLIVVLTIFHCLNIQPSQAGWGKLLSYTEQQRPLKKTPKVKFLYSEGNEVSIMITNDTGGDLKYSGYSSTSPQIFTKDFKGGKWVTGPWGWCGTGMEDYVLKATEVLIVKLRTRSNSQSYTRFSNLLNQDEYSMVKLHETLINE